MSLISLPSISISTVSHTVSVHHLDIEVASLAGVPLGLSDAIEDE